MSFAEEKFAYIYLDEQHNMAIFPFTKNPNYSEECTDLLTSEPEYTFSKKPIELMYPYPVELLAGALQNAIEQWGKQEAYTNKRVSIEEYYYKIRGFKKASLRKRLLIFGWDSSGEKNVSLSLPTKARMYYLTLANQQLPADATWMDFAHAILELVHTNVTTLDTYKTFKSKLNV